MSSVHERSEPAAETPAGGTVDMKLEVIVVPVSDVDRAKGFYVGLGGGSTPTSSSARTSGSSSSRRRARRCSIIFGTGVTSAEPGSAQGLHLIVSDIAAARDALVAHGADVSEVFHDAGGVFHHAGTTGRVSGPDPEHRSYGSFASFEDPDGNGWLFQEITTRLPGRIDPAATSFASASDLSQALQRAAAAHGEHEARIGRADPDWPDWYAEYMVREQAGEELPS